jgi:hypothetical protein
LGAAHFHFRDTATISIYLLCVDAIQMTEAFAEDTSTNETTYYYKIFGFTFETEEPVPGLPEAPGEEGAIRIRLGAVPDAIRQPENEGRFSQVGAGEYLYSRPGVMRLYAGGEGEIVVERRSGNARFWNLVFSIAASIAVYRSRCVPLHASAVEARGGCIALAGQSGAGKSTLAASLVQHGFALHSDDLCLIQPGPGGPLVGAGVREVRLRDDAVEILGWTGTAERPPDIAKAIYPVDGAGAALLPLKRIYVLQFADGTTPAGIRRLGGVEALQALMGCLRMHIETLPAKARRRTFESLASISNAVELYRLVRPGDRTRLHEWTERLAAHLSA